VAAITGFPRRSITIFNARTGDSRRLTNAAESVGYGVAWSPDGATLYYQIEQPNGKWAIVRHNSTGSTRPETIGHEDFAVTLMDISPDGKYLIFGPNPAGGSSYYRLATSGAANAKLEVFATFGPNFRPRGAQGRFTPDGKYVFAAGLPSEGHFIPWLPTQPVVTIDAGTVAFRLYGQFFSRDGRRLCGVDRDRAAISCHSVTPVLGSPPALGPPAVLFSSGLPQFSTYGKVAAIAKDGRVLLLSTDEREEVEFQFLSDWTMLLPGAKE
jgi:WD40 repeat protein